MNKKRTWLVVAGVVLCLLATFAAVAQDDTGPEPEEMAPVYTGSEVCMACHDDVTGAWEMTLHAHNLLEATEENVFGDLSEEGAPVITWPDGEERSLTLADIDYVISGRYTQDYVTIWQPEDGDETYYVLPVRWSMPQAPDQEGVWTSYYEGDWAARDFMTQCVGCHVTGLTAEKVAGGWTLDDVEMNVGCEACHGPGSQHIRAPSEGHIYSAPDAQVCGQCHMIGTTPDGEHAFPLEYQPGDTLDQSVFVPADMDNTEVWWPTGHAKKMSNQYAEWLLSGHDEAEFYEYGVNCMSCHEVHAVGRDPETCENCMLKAEPDTLCLTCHENVRSEEGIWFSSAWEMLQGEQIVEQVEGVPSGHFIEMRGVSCTTCHMTPTVEIGAYRRTGTHTMRIVDPAELGEGEPDTCTGCHDDLSAQALQQLIEGTQRNVTDRLTKVQNALEAYEGELPDWVLEVVNFVEADGSGGVHNQEYTDALLYAVEVELGMVEAQGTAQPAIVMEEVRDPDTCAECHPDAYDLWLSSPHATASLTDIFTVTYAERGRPGFCMQCHASGYDPDTEEYVFEGVICSNCHTPENGSEHPPSPMSIDDSAAQCGTCHSGAHAPTYDEWLASKHKAVGVDCVDCHTPHNNGLLLRNVNTTCGSCHAEALVDEVHMGQDMNCVDCHLPRVLDSDGVHVVSTGHTMNINPGTCAECHGKAHVLTMEEGEEGLDVDMPLTPEEEVQLNTLEEKVAELEETARTNWNSGVVGGAMGMFFVAIVAIWILRRGKVL